MLDHKTVSLADQVYEVLETDILSGKYSRGDVLTENKLCEILGVSRTPIREALRRLEQENLIKESGKGSVVVGITEKDLDDIFTIRRQIEGLAAGLAAKNCTDEEIDEITDKIDSIQKVRYEVINAYLKDNKELDNLLDNAYDNEIEKGKQKTKK